MGRQNDIRDKDEVTRFLSYVNEALPLYHRRVRDAQRRLDDLLRDKDHAVDRLYVLNHEFQEAK